MAAQVVSHEGGAILYQTVQRWDRRLRWKQVVFWLPASILPGLLLGIALGFVARMRPLLMPDQLALITALAVAGGIAGLFLYGFLKPRTSLEAARRFDVMFSLQERVSTALELLEGRIQAQEELAAYQLADATARASQIEVKDKLPLRINWRLWAGTGLLFVLLLLLLLLPNPQVAAMNSITARQVALDDAAAEVRDITQTVAADPNLTDEQRAELLQALKNSQETLERPEVSLEEAYAALNEAQAQLQDQSELFSQKVNADQQAMQNAADVLRNAAPPDSNNSTQSEQSSLSEMLNQLAQQADSMNAQSQQNAANALQQAADQLANTDPALADQLQQAAQNLQDGDTQAAQQNLQQAQQQAQNAQQQTQAAQQLSQQLQQGSQQLAEQAQQLTQSQSGQPQDSPNQSGQPQAQQSGSQPGDQSQAGDTGEAQQQQPGEGDQGQAGSPQAGSGEMQSTNQTGGESGNNPGQSPDGAGASAGDAPGGAGTDETNAGRSGPIEANNNPDGQGVGQYESIFAPQHIGGQGTEQIVLEPDASNAPAVEGEFAENAAGDVNVPYNQVFSDYSNAANRALESDYIPLGLRDVIRDYFSSLEPGQ